MQPVSEPADLAGAFSEMKADHAEAVFVLPDLMLAHEAPRIAALALEQQLPIMAWGGWFTEVGCSDGVFRTIRSDRPPACLLSTAS